MRDDAPAAPLAIGTTPPGTMMFALGKTLVWALGGDGIAAEARPYGGTGILIPLVQSGGLDLSFCGTGDLYDQFHGVGASDGRPNPDIRAIGVLFPNRFAFFVRQDSPIRSRSDLAGCRVPYGFNDMPTVRANVDALLANAGLTAADIVAVPVRNLIDNVDALIDGRADLAFFALGQPKVAQANAAVGGIRFLPVDPAPDAVARLRTFIRTGYVGTVAPAADLPGVVDPMTVAQYDVVAVVNVAMPAKRVETLLRTLVGRRSDMTSGMPLFRDLDVARMYQAFDVPYHPGAAAHYAAMGLAQAKTPG
jgi:TRAP transporter TAXI family solute receptor